MEKALSVVGLPSNIMNDKDEGFAFLKLMLARNLDLNGISCVVDRLKTEVEYYVRGSVDRVAYYSGGNLSVSKVDLTRKQYSLIGAHAALEFAK